MSAAYHLGFDILSGPPSLHPTTCSCSFGMSTAIPEIPPIESFPPINVYPREAEIIKYCNDYVAEHFPFNNDAEVKHFNGMEIPAYACRGMSYDCLLSIPLAS